MRFTLTATWINSMGGLTHRVYENLTWAEVSAHIDRYVEEGDVTNVTIEGSYP